MFRLPASSSAFGKVIHSQTVKKKPKRIRLTAAQSRSWIQFNYYSFEKPKLTFEQVALKVLGRNPFPHTPQGRKFKQECRKVFDREREV